MAQSFPTSAQVIYETLAADTVFTNLLGSYSFKDTPGDITAISVISAGEDLPSLRGVQGIECIIQDAGSVVQRSYLSSSADPVTSWGLFLVSWEPSNGADLQAATERILSRFVGAQAIQVVGTVDGLGSLVQNKIVITSDNAIVSL